MRWVAALYASLRALLITTLVGGDAAHAEQPSDADDAAWSRARTTGTAEAIQGYLERFPVGRHVEDAFRGLIEHRIESEVGSSRGLDHGPAMY